MMAIRQPLALIATLSIVLLGKTIVAAAVLLWSGYRLRTALVVSVSLSQIGEFSFILAGLAVALNVLPLDAQSLILSTALISITLNPAMFAIGARTERWVRATPGLLEALERKQSDIHGSPAGVKKEKTDHAILVGYGRVGHTIAKALHDQHTQFVIIEANRAAVGKARKDGFDAIWGDASRPGILALANPEQARLLVVAAPDPYQGRQVLKLARNSNPTIDTVMRTHSLAEQEHLEKHGVGRAVLGERETALAMTHYALVSLGLSDDQADAAVEWSREGVS